MLEWDAGVKETGDKEGRERAQGYLSRTEERPPLHREETDLAHRQMRFIKWQTLC